MELASKENWPQFSRPQLTRNPGWFLTREMAIRTPSSVVATSRLDWHRLCKAIWDTQTGEFTTKAHRTQRKGNEENQ
jgi:hypothetical protein